MRSDWLIRFLLRLYPEEFRARYAREMLDFHHERMHSARATSWPRIVGDHLKSASVESMSAFSKDAHYALRGIIRRPVFSAVVLLTIALGIGVNTAIFSVVDAILLRPLPFRHAERLVTFGHSPPTWLVSDAEFLDYKRDLSSFEALSAFHGVEGNITGGGEADHINITIATRDFFETLGAAPQLGRVFSEGEDLVRPATVAIISHALWQRRFGGDSAVIGKTIELNGMARTIVGVMPRHFNYPSAQTELWLPLKRFDRDTTLERTNHFLMLVGRLRPGVSRERAVNEASTMAKRIMANNPGSYNPNEPLTPVLKSMRDELLGPTTSYLWALLGAVGFILLIVCVNVANLLLSRGESRRKEMALRTALGASRARLVVQLLTECLILALAGGAIGLLLAWGLQHVLVAVAPSTIPRLDEISLDWTAVLYTIIISTLAGLVFGISPAIRAGAEAPVATLKIGGSGTHQGGSQRVRQALVVAEVALAVIMLSGAGMMLRSLFNLQSAELGFGTRSVLTAKISLPGASAAPGNRAQYDEARTVVFFDQLLERVRAIPGVESAAAAGWLPVVGAGGLWGTVPEGGVPAGRDWPTLVPQQVTTGYFDAMKMRVVAGRAFGNEDRAGGPYTAVLSEAGAKLLFPDAKNPLGKRFTVGGPGSSQMVTVVGVVNDIRSRGYHDTPEPTMYFPLPQTNKTAFFMPRTMSLIVRTNVDPMRVAATVRGIVKELDPNVPVTRIEPLADVVGMSVANRRFSTALLAGFALLALVLSGLGIFGVISHAVSERTFEIGVRIALGARQSQVLRLVVSEGLRMALFGVALGLAGAAALGTFIRSMLIGVPPFDPTTMVVVSGVLVLIALLASLLPARRAMVVSPMEALRG